MTKRLFVNLRQFSEETDLSKYLVDGEFDVDSMVNDYSATIEGEENPNPEPETPETPEVPEVPEAPETPGQPEPPETPETPETPQGDDVTPPETPEDKRTPDQAFAQMRRQIEQYEPIAQWVQDLAAQQGFKDPQELIKAFQERKLAQEAEAQGVPVDVYKRLHELEQDNQQKTKQMQAERFNNEVETVKNKYNLDDAALNEVFRFMGQNNYVDEQGAPTIAFEDAYVLANRDNLIKDAEERGRQSYLETKRQQQQTATPDAGTGAEDGSKGGDALDYSSEGILNTFAKMGIPID